MAKSPNLKSVIDDLVEAGTVQRDRATAALEEALAVGRRRTDELSKIVRREVERQLRALGLLPQPVKKTAKKTPAKKTAAKKTAAKKTAAKKTAAKKTAAKKTPAKKTAAKKTPANKAVAKKAAAKR